MMTLRCYLVTHLLSYVKLGKAGGVQKVTPHSEYLILHGISILHIHFAEEELFNQILFG